MDFEINKEQKLLVKGMRDFITKEFPKQYFRDCDEQKKWPIEALKGLGELGYLGLAVPEEWDGYGGNSLDVTLCIEEAARSMGGPAMAYFTTVCFGSHALTLFGSEKQKKEIFPGLLSGDDFVALAMTMALYGAAFGLLFPSVSAMIADQALPEERGMASGIFHALLTAGVAIGAPAMGGIGSIMGVEMGLTLSPVILVIALGMSLTISKKVRSHY